MEGPTAPAGVQIPHAFAGRASVRNGSSSVRPSKAPKVPELGSGDLIGAGDSQLVMDLLPPELAETAFEKLREEVKWTTMYHRGGEVPRLVAVEGEVGGDGSFPVYRHPADESPPLSQFSSTVAKIRERVQQVIEHPVNHVLIQYYRSGKDYISEHSDKTIDVVRGSNIVNVSLGAQRVMTLRTKKDREPDPVYAPEISPGSEQLITADSASAPVTDASPGQPAPNPGPPRTSQRIPLPNNSMFVMGPLTNEKWLHGINHDNRPQHTKSAAEQREGGGRISLTFRHIGTFLSRDETRIWGQGAKGKTKATAGRVVNGTKEAERLIWAFGDENRKSEFDCEGVYGEGFDVLHFKEREEEDT